MVIGPHPALASLLPTSQHWEWTHPTLPKVDW